MSSISSEKSAEIRENKFTFSPPSSFVFKQVPGILRSACSEYEFFVFSKNLPLTNGPGSCIMMLNITFLYGENSNDRVSKSVSQAQRGSGRCELS